jgi:pilus assembly protein CpaF
VFSIIISEKSGAERKQAFERSVVTVGRVQDNDLPLAKGNVSKRHCRIELNAGRFIVTDEDSTNGTYVNRRRISQPTVVREGDRIYVGDFILRLELTVDPSSVSSTEGRVEGEDIVNPSREFDSSQEDAAKVQEQVRFSNKPVSMLQDPAGPVREELEFGRTTTLDDDNGVGSAGLRARSHVTTSSFPISGSDFMIGTPRAGGAAERAAARALIEEVWKRLEPRLLERVLDADTTERVERILSEQSNQLPNKGHAIAGAALEQALALARAEVFGLGPLEPLLEDDRTTEVLVMGAHKITSVRDGYHQELAPFCHPVSVEWVLARLCRQAGAELADQENLVLRTLKRSGYLVEAIRGLSDSGMLMRISRQEQNAFELDDLVHVGTLSRAMANFLRQCVAARANLWIVGRPLSGNQDLLMALGSATAGPWAWVSWSPEPVGLRPSFECTRLAARPGLDAARLFAMLLRMGQRVVSLNPPAEGLRALGNAVANGLDGVLMVTEARSLSAAVTFHNHQLATPEVSPTNVGRMLAATFDVAIEVVRLGDGRSRVMRIAELNANPDGSPADVFDFVVERTASGGSIEGHFRATGHAPALLGALRARGIAVDESVFLRRPSE